MFHCALPLLRSLDGNCAGSVDACDACHAHDSRRINSSGATVLHWLPYCAQGVLFINNVMNVDSSASFNFLFYASVLCLRSTTSQAPASVRSTCPIAAHATR